MAPSRPCARSVPGSCALASVQVRPTRTRLRRGSLSRRGRSRPPNPPGCRAALRCAPGRLPSALLVAASPSSRSSMTCTEVGEQAAPGVLRCWPARPARSPVAVRLRDPSDGRQPLVRRREPVFPTGGSATRPRGSQGSRRGPRLRHAATGRLVGSPQAQPWRPSSPPPSCACAPASPGTAGTPPPRWCSFRSACPSAQSAAVDRQSVAHTPEQSSVGAGSERAVRAVQGGSPLGSLDGPGWPFMVAVGGVRTSPPQRGCAAGAPKGLSSVP